MDTKKDIERREGPVSVDAGTTAPRRHVFVWVAVALAIIAWIILMWSNGYVALGVAVAACAAGFWGASDSGRGMKRLAIAAIIAAMVLIVVLAAFLIVIKIGLS